MNDAKSEGEGASGEEPEQPVDAVDAPQAVGSGADFGGDPEELAGALAELEEAAPEAPPAEEAPDQGPEAHEDASPPMPAADAGSDAALPTGDEEEAASPEEPPAADSAEEQGRDSASDFESVLEGGSDSELASSAESDSDSDLETNAAEPSKPELGSRGEDPDSDSDSEEASAPAEVDPESMVPVLEAILFASPEPLTAAALRKVFDGAVAWASVRSGLELLAERTAEAGRGILLAEVAGGWQFLTREEHWPRVQRVARTRQEERLTPAAIETLSVIAYKQPITRSEVDGLRGVSSSSMVKALEQRGLVKVVGRADQPGQPYQYGTTRRFLEHFGLRSVRDLPDPRSAARPLSAGESPES